MTDNDRAVYEHTGEFTAPTSFLSKHGFVAGNTEPSLKLLCSLNGFV